MSTNWNKSTHTDSKNYANNPQKYIREDLEQSRASVIPIPWPQQILVSSIEVPL